VETTHNNDAPLQLILLAAVLIPAIFFLLTEHKTLQLIRPENRHMQPGLVWLQLIPLLGQVWQFFVVARIAGSIKKELESPQGDSIIGLSDVFAAGTAGTKPTLGIGITYCTLNALLVFYNFTNLKNVPALAGLLGLAGMICWIVYWVQLAGYKNKLKRLLLAA
jgi:hypothetical protein